MTDATHTRESDDWREALDGCVRSLRKGDLSEWELHLVQRRVDDAMRRISSPIPLTPSDDLEYRLGAAYQVIGCFLDYLGVFDSENGQKLLDYFGGRDGASDPLPFSVACLPITPSDEMVEYLLSRGHGGWMQNVKDRRKYCEETLAEINLIARKK